MSKEIFIDSDIIIDLLAKRDGFYHYAARIFTLAHEKKVKAYTTALVLANVFYIVRKIRGSEEGKKQLKDLRLIIDILPVNDKIVDMTLNSDFGDLEDGIQYFTARENKIPAIITRNTKDYKVRDMIIQTSEEYIKTNFPDI